MATEIKKLLGTGGRAVAPTLIVTPDSQTSFQLEQELKDFSLLHFPDREILPYDRFLPHPSIISQRQAVLHKITTMQQGSIITPVTTLMDFLPPRTYLDAHTFLLAKGDKIDLSFIRERLTKAGYYNVPQVHDHGEFSVRGSLMDLFPMGSHLPYRIDFFDNEIDSIRTFSPETQRSLDVIEKIQLLPAEENTEETATLFDYLPQNTQIICVGDILSQAENFWQFILKRYEEMRYDRANPILSPERAFIPATEITKRLENATKISLTALLFS